MNRELQKFIPRFVRFVFPYAAITIFTVVVFYKSGEIFWLNKTLQAQIKDRRNFIYGAAYSNIPHYFKLTAVENISPKILALGSSRVLQFRSAFFKDSIPFYNTGGVFNRIEQLRAFLESLPEENLPQTIILGLDQWWFNSRYDSSVKTKNDLVYNRYSWFNNWSGMSAWQNFYYDWWNGKISWKKLWTEKKSEVEWFGISARNTGHGFRRDGSCYYGKLLADSNSLKCLIYNAIENVNTDEGKLQWTNSIDKCAVNELRLFLRFCKKHKITVTGFLPPANSMVMNEMKLHTEHFPYFFKLNEQLNRVFRENGFRIYDFTVPENYGSNDKEMIDAFHASEKSSLKLYLQLLRKDTYLNQFSDSTFLKIKLDSADGNFDVFGNY